MIISKRVKCINDNVSPFQQGQEYLAVEECELYYNICDKICCYGGWNKTRFEIMEETMSIIKKIKVICVDDGGFTNLIKGQTYEVEDDSTTNDYEIGGKKFYKHRFQVVPQVPLTPLSLSGLTWGMVRPAASGKVSSGDSLAQSRKIVDEVIREFGLRETKETKEDKEEERLRNLLKPHTDAHTCICGIARKQCDYHK